MAHAMVNGTEENRADGHKRPCSRKANRDNMKMGAIWGN